MDYERQRAFTLVELMIALAILVIAVSLAAPSMTQLYRKHQLDAYQAELMRLIVQARQHALINQRRVTLCALNAQGGCVSLKAGVLTSFVDGNGNRALDAGETLLQPWPFRATCRRTGWGQSPCIRCISAGRAPPISVTAHSPCVTRRV